MTARGHWASERRHRRDLQRIEEGHSRGFAELEKAEALARRAANAERNDAVSSDDPAALTKLQGEVKRLTLAHARWRAINAALRPRKTGKLEALELTHNERRTLELSQGWTSYKTTNLAANIRRVKARIQVLEVQAPRGEVADVSIGDIVLREHARETQLVCGSACRVHRSPEMTPRFGCRPQLVMSPFAQLEMSCLGYPARHEDGDGDHEFERAGATALGGRAR